MLIGKKKFDFRIYVAITCINPLRIYIYQEGLVRFATEDYSMNKKIFGNQYIHLTNYSINKHNKYMDFSEKIIIKTKDQTRTKWTFK